MEAIKGAPGAAGRADAGSSAFAGTVLKNVGHRRLGGAWLPQTGSPVQKALSI